MSLESILVMERSLTDWALKVKLIKKSSLKVSQQLKIMQSILSLTEN